MEEQTRSSLALLSLSYQTVGGDCVLEVEGGEEVPRARLPVMSSTRRRRGRTEKGSRRTAEKRTGCRNLERRDGEEQKAAQQWDGMKGGGVRDGSGSMRGAGTWAGVDVVRGGGRAEQASPGDWNRTPAQARDTSDE